MFGVGSTLDANFNACTLFIESKLRQMGAMVLLMGMGDETEDPQGAFRDWPKLLIPLTRCDQ